ncbi:hypothetical protein ACROYT_G011378 [Oculina patagonica]
MEPSPGYATAINTSTIAPRIWKRYVDDSFVIIKKDAVPSSHGTLNSIDSKIAFTIEEENNGQISFLDTLVSRKNGVIVIDVYRKPTHTDRYLDYSSHPEIKHKVSTASTLLFRAANLPSTCEGKARETSHVTEALKANGYPPTVISNILKKKSAPTTPPPEELVSMFFNWADPSDTSLGFACLPYIRGLTEPLTRLLRKNDIRVVSKPAKTLQQEFPSPKFRQPLDLQFQFLTRYLLLKASRGGYLNFEPGSEPESEPGFELGSEPGFELGSELGSEQG